MQENDLEINKRKKQVGRFFQVVAILLLAFSIAVTVFILYSISPPPYGEISNSVESNNAEETYSSAQFDIKSGQSLKTISDSLEKNGFIRNALVMRLISKVKGTEQQMKTGKYKIEFSMNAIEIHNLIVSGVGLLHKVTIPEGLTSSKIAILLEEKGITTGEDFLVAVKDKSILEKFNIQGNSLEGFLYPDSYFFPSEYPSTKVVSVMVENFFEKLEIIFPEYKSFTAEEILDKVVLASIVEREYRVPAEAPIMSSVFTNRLDIRMSLGSCATVEYIITEIEKKPHPEYITWADTEIESVYNTYIKIGLPPGPISNPGKIALEAAFMPAETDYLYFLLKNVETGEHFFSKSNSEHNQARVIYLKR